MSYLVFEVGDQSVLRIESDFERVSLLTQIFVLDLCLIEHVLESLPLVRLRCIWIQILLHLLELSNLLFEAILDPSHSVIQVAGCVDGAN